MEGFTDAQLLRAYAEEHSEAAFDALVRRHAPLVHSAALRIANDACLAQDVTQRVFVALARNARKLSGRPVLAGWLHTTARNLAVETIRRDTRRRAREEEAAEMHGSTGDAEATWEQVAAELDHLLGKLRESERELLLLRFFEKQDMRRIGVRLGISEDAAQKRVSRALERLRGLFVSRGVRISAASLGAIVSTNAVQAVPPALLSAWCGAAALAAATPTPLVITSLLTMNSVTKSLVVAAAVVAGSMGVYEAHRASQYRGQLRQSRAQEIALRQEIQKLTQERDDARRAIPARGTEDGSSAQASAELMRLRSEVTALRETARERAQARFVTDTWEARIETLKEQLNQMPAHRIPEMAFLSDKDWAAATRNADLTTDSGIRQALRDLRRAAKENFLEALRSAIREYVAEKSGQALPDDSKGFADLVNANPWVFPNDLADLKRHLTVPVEDHIFERYEFRRPERLNEWLTGILVKEVAPPVDDEYDTRHEMGLNGGSVGPVNRIAEWVAQAAKSYAQAHGGEMPGSPEQLSPYLAESLDLNVVRKYWARIGLGQPAVSADVEAGQD